MDPRHPVTDGDELLSIAFGFMASKAMLSGLEVGLFDGLAEGPRTLSELSATTGVADRPLITLLTALASIGLVTGTGDRYANAPAVDQLLTSRSPGSIGEWLRHQVDRRMYPLMGDLETALREGGTETYEAWMDDATEAEAFSRAQHVVSTGMAELLVEQVDLAGTRSLLDVGGGTGAFPIALCGRYPELVVTVIDFPNVVEVGRQLVAEAGLEDRISFVPGDARATDWPGEQGAVLMSYLWSGVSGEAVARLAGAAHRALAPGGLLLVHDILVDDDRDGPPMAALWALQHLTFTPGAVSMTPTFVRALLDTSGFSDVTVAPLIEGMTSLVQARRPRP